MNVHRVVRAAACTVALALAVGSTDAVARVGPSAERALQKDATVDSLIDSLAQPFERKREPDNATAPPALLSVWNDSSSPFTSAAAASTPSKLQSPDVCQLKHLNAVHYSGAGSFVYLDAGANHQQHHRSIASAPLWKAEDQGRSVLSQSRDDVLQRKVADASGQTSWSSLWKVETDESAFSYTASASSCHHTSSSLIDAFEFTQERQNGGDRGHYPDVFLEEAAGFSVVFEDSCALSADEINDVLSVLEEVTSDALPQPISSSRAVMPQEIEQGGVAELLASNAATVDETPDVFSFSVEAHRVDEEVTGRANRREAIEDDAVELSPVLDVSTRSGDDGAVTGGGSVGNLTQPNWIDSLEMDNISSCLFPEMQQSKEVSPQLDAMATSAATATGKIDSRVYVPRFSVRIEGRAPVGAVESKRAVQRKGSSSSPTASPSRLPVGPQAFLVGPPPPTFAANSLSRKDRVERWKEKRRVRSFVPRAPNPNLSESRKAVAAKRRRVGGRFIVALWHETIDVLVVCGMVKCAKVVEWIPRDRFAVVRSLRDAVEEATALDHVDAIAARCISSFKDFQTHNIMSKFEYYEKKARATSTQSSSKGGTTHAPASFLFLHTAEQSAKRPRLQPSPPFASVMMNSDESKLIIVSLEGCHGCGKTALCAEFEAQGYSVLDEAFMDMPSYALHPQSLLMETSWVCSWFERVLRLASRVRKEKNPDFRKQVYIADRSPFSAVLYSSNGHLLEPVIREQMREVEEQTNVQFYTVHIAVEPELLWSRIVGRLEHEPERIRFNEHKRSWMEETLAFYNSFKWDLTVSNDERSVATIVDNISDMLVEQDANFRVVYERTKSLSCTSSVASTDSDLESVEDCGQLLHDSPAPSPKSMRSIIAFNNCDLDF